MMDLHLQSEFERLGAQSPWKSSFTINGKAYGSGLNHELDVRPPQFFRLVPDARRILELGSCQGGGTFQLAKYPGVREIVALEGRDYHLEKARYVQKALDIHNVTFLQADLETFDFGPLGRFDAVYCVGLLYHLPEPWSLLEKLARVADTVYINTHYCYQSRANMTLNGYEGSKWLEAGYADPLSGLSAWSFWPTLKSLTKILLDTGFVPEIHETDTVGKGQAPHGTTILARRTARLPNSEVDALLERMERTLELAEQLEQSQDREAKLAEQLGSAQKEADLLRSQIRQMEASKFWKIRKLWMRVKRSIPMAGSRT
jgi:SAM-dependent methyltransferase